MINPILRVCVWVQHRTNMDRQLHPGQRGRVAGTRGIRALMHTTAAAKNRGVPTIRQPKPGGEQMVAQPRRKHEEEGAKGTTHGQGTVRRYPLENQSARDRPVTEEAQQGIAREAAETEERWNNAFRGWSAMERDGLQGAGAAQGRGGGRGGEGGGDMQLVEHTPVSRPQKRRHSGNARRRMRRKKFGRQGGQGMGR